VDIYEAISARRNVHKFKTEEVPQDKLKKILEAGLQASSAFNMQPWEFVVTTDQDLIQKLAQFKYDHNMQGLLASNVPQEEAEQLAGAQRDAFANCVAVATVAEGLGMSPAYFGLPAQGPIKEMLGVPEGYDIAAVLRIGVPEVIPDAKPRKSLEECLHENRF
jgi:nitroreductase